MPKTKTGTSVFGFLLVIAGCIGLLSNFGFVDLAWWRLWPLVILAAGLAFEFSFFAVKATGKDAEAGLLVPGGILTTIGLLFTVCEFFDWDWMEVLWPLFILAPAIGLFQVYLFGTREKAFLVPVAVLSAIGLPILLSNLGILKLGTVFASVLMILGGLYLLMTSRKEQ